MSTTLENEDLLKLAAGGKMRRRRRMSRALLAHLIGERAEGEGNDYEAEEGDEGEKSERKIARLLIGSRLLRRRRLRNLLIAHLLRERGEAGEGEEDEGEDEYGQEGGGGEHKLARLLIGSRILRRGRVRRMLVAHLLRERGEAGEEEDEGEDEYGEEGGGGEHKLARLLLSLIHI